MLKILQCFFGSFNFFKFLNYRLNNVSWCENKIIVIFYLTLREGLKWKIEFSMDNEGVGKKDIQKLNTKTGFVYFWSVRQSIFPYWIFMFQIVHFQMILEGHCLNINRLTAPLYINLGGGWVGQVRFLLSKYVNECYLLVGVQEITFHPYLCANQVTTFFTLLLSPCSCPTALPF